MYDAPPFTVSESAINRVVEIAAAVEHYALHFATADALFLRKANRIRSIQGSLAIEANSLTLAETTAVLDGRHVVAPANEIREVLNAKRAYNLLPSLNPYDSQDLLQAHKMLLDGLSVDAGRYRRSGVGVFSERGIVHLAPPADRVPELMASLMEWVSTSKAHELIKAAVFHYELEFIHPFADGNGRMGRLWQTLILAQWRPLFYHLPIESIVCRNQAAYYEAIAATTKITDASPFIDFMLQCILDALTETPLSLSEVAMEYDPDATGEGVNGGLNKGASEGVNALLDLITAHPGQNAIALAAALGKSKSTVERYLVQLKRTSRVVFKGAPKNGGYWRV